MSNAEVTVTHPLLSQPLTLEVERDFLTRALSGYNPMAEKALAIKVRDAYNQQHNQKVRYLPWSGLQIEETGASQQRPQGCGCGCAGCDDQGYHCHRADRDCYL